MLVELKAVCVVEIALESIVDVCCGSSRAILLESLGKGAGDGVHLCTELSDGFERHRGGRQGSYCQWEEPSGGMMEDWAEEGETERRDSYVDGLEGAASSQRRSVFGDRKLTTASRHSVGRDRAVSETGAKDGGRRWSRMECGRRRALDESCKLGATRSTAGERAGR